MACGNCAGASLATGAGAQFGVRPAPVLAVPLPIGGTMILPRPPQALPPVNVTAKPFPWGWIIAGVVVALIATRGR